MKGKLFALIKSLFWGICILLFPIFSGTLSAVLSLETIEALFLQGSFMLISLVIPLIFVLTGKWEWNEIGFSKIDIEGCKRAFYFLPLLTILLHAYEIGSLAKIPYIYFKNIEMQSIVDRLRIE